MVVSGPVAKLDEGLAMAKAFILESQINGRADVDHDDDDQGPDDLGRIEEPQPSRPHRRSQQQQQQQPAHVGMQMPFVPHVQQPTMPFGTKPFMQFWSAGDGVWSADDAVWSASVYAAAGHDTVYATPSHGGDDDGNNASAANAC